MPLLPDLIIREVCARGLALLRNLPEFVKEIFDAERQFDPTIADRMIEFLRNHPNIPCVVNFPAGDIENIPCLAVITLQSREDERNSWVGDQAGYDPIIGPETAVTGFDNPDWDGTKVVAYAERVGSVSVGNYNIVVTTGDPLQTSVLTALVRAILFLAKHRMELYYGMQALGLEDYDFAFPKDYWPKLTWSKTVRVKLFTQTIYPMFETRNTEDEDLWDAVVPAIREFNTQNVTPQSVTLIEGRNENT